MQWGAILSLDVWIMHNGTSTSLWATKVTSKYYGVPFTDGDKALSLYSLYCRYCSFQMSLCTWILTCVFEVLGEEGSFSYDTAADWMHVSVHCISMQSMLVISEQGWYVFRHLDGSLHLKESHCLFVKFCSFKPDVTSTHVHSLRYVLNCTKPFSPFIIVFCLSKTVNVWYPVFRKHVLNSKMLNRHYSRIKLFF